MFVGLNSIDSINELIAHPHSEDLLCLIGTLFSFGSSLDLQKR
jgi:hypothetical protein